MALSLSTVTSVAEDTSGLLDAVEKLRNAGLDEKTDQIERDALALIEKLLGVVAEAGGEGSADSAQLQAALEAEEAALKKFLSMAEPTLGERISLLNRLSDVQFKLGKLKIGETLTWDRLLSAAEIAMFEQALQEAADQVRRRRKLRSVVRSIFSLLTIGSSLASKILLL